MTTTIPPNDLATFQSHLSASKRVLALLGAGLSASSGLPTFRGAGGLWRSHDAISLATVEAFRHDPGFVWQFYSYRRHMALNARPNPAHFALAEYAKRNPNFVTLSQNVDGLSPRAGHPAEQLKLLHGNLFDVKCANRKCGWKESSNYADPIVPALAIPSDGRDPTELNQVAGHDTSSQSATRGMNPLIRGIDISSADVPLPSIPKEDLPHCPKCKTSLSRPGVVWFGESLPRDVLDDVDEFMSNSEPIDLMLVVGTSATVYPAAAYAQAAKVKGAKIAVVNMDEKAAGNDEADWVFVGDAAVVLPVMLKPVIGDVTGMREERL